MAMRPLKNALFDFTLYRVLRPTPLERVPGSAKSRKRKILAAGIHGVFRGLKFESDAELVQRGAVFKGLILYNPAAVIPTALPGQPHPE